MVYQMVHWHAKQQMVIYFQNDDCNNMKKFTYLLIFLACIISFATKAGDSRGGICMGNPEGKKYFKQHRVDKWIYAVN